MSDEVNRERIHHAVDLGLASLTGDKQLAQRILCGKQKEIHMKKRISITLVIAMIIVLLTTVAAAVALSNYEALMSLLQDSFRRMNTSSSGHIYDRGEFDLEAFEDYYQSYMGDESGTPVYKDDLVICTVPDEGRLTCDGALSIARQSILDTFGTPEAELDAMGVYPMYFEEVYNADDPGEWEFYFTPRRDVDIEEDHAVEAPGEYRVFINATTGGINSIIWYTDAWFWPDYAQRAWDAGHHDFVYKQAQTIMDAPFHRQPKASQQHFLTLFADSGYDTAALQRTDEELLAAQVLSVRYTEPENDLMTSDDPCAAAARLAMQERYGFTADEMTRLLFAQSSSPLPSDGTRDYIFTANDSYTSDELLTWYASRFGMFLIRIDPDTCEAVSSVHCYAKLGPSSWLMPPEDLPEGTPLMDRQQWTHDDVPELFSMPDERLKP